MKVILLIVTLMIAMSAQAERIMIFAAASTTNAINEIIEKFENETGIETVASYASSGTLAKQINSNAPANIFLSANPKWLNWLEVQGKIEETSTTDLLANRLAIITASDVTIKKEMPTTELLSKAHRIAIADPAHSPAGMYTQSAIEAMGIWETVSKKLVRMQTVRVALVMVERSATPIGIVYSSDAESSKNVKTARLIDESLHKPIKYPMAMVKGKATKEAKLFYDYLQGKKASDIFVKYGFQVD